MSDDAPQAPAEDKSETPAWVMTFADLMSLLLTFFILLLSFAELNATKFRKVAGSLKMAFGVQRVTVFDEPPSGSSFIQQEHRAGGASAPMGGASVALMDPELQAIKKKQQKNSRAALIEKEKMLKRNVKKVWEKLSTEIKQGKLEITHKDQNLIIRINEDAIYPEGKALMQKDFQGLLDKISDILHDVEGDIHVSGHTDDRKFKSSKYRSNWELSVARAMTLGQALIARGEISEDRLTIEAHGPTQPVVRNNSNINRKKNRRTEIRIKH